MEFTTAIFTNGATHSAADSTPMMSAESLEATSDEAVQHSLESTAPIIGLDESKKEE